MGTPLNVPLKIGGFSKKTTKLNWSSQPGIEPGLRDERLMSYPLDHKVLHEEIVYEIELKLFLATHDSVRVK